MPNFRKFTRDARVLVSDPPIYKQPRAYDCKRCKDEGKLNGKPCSQCNFGACGECFGECEIKVQFDYKTGQVSAAPSDRGYANLVSWAPDKTQPWKNVRARIADTNQLLVPARCRCHRLFCEHCQGTTKTVDSEGCMGTCQECLPCDTCNDFGTVKPRNGPRVDCPDCLNK